MAHMNRRRFLQLAGGIVILGTLDFQSYSTRVSKTQLQPCQDLLKITLNGLEALVEPKTGLPYDIVNAMTLKPEDRIGSDNPYKSSPLEIGLYLAGLLAKRDLGFESTETIIAKISKTLQTLESEQANETITFTTRDGQQVTTMFPYKWLDPRSGERTENWEIPAIDDGQLAYCLAVLTEAFHGTTIAAQAQKLLDRMDFRLFERQDGTLAMAYERGKLSQYRIDIWGSEAIVTALLGIVKDGVSPNALPRPSREPGEHVKTYTTIDGREIKVIPAYCGSLFTTLFPIMFWGAQVHEGILENARRYVIIHEQEGKRLGWKVWGWAPAQDPDGSYHEYGVPAVNKFGTPLQNVVAPYASMLALNLEGHAQAKAEIQAVMANLQELQKFPPSEGREVFNEGRGFTDSVEPTSSRLAGNILALDKGMEALSLYNYCQRAAGKPGFDTYFWAYLQRIGKADLARQLLAERGKEILSLIGEQA